MVRKIACAAGGIALAGAAAFIVPVAGQGDVRVSQSTTGKSDRLPVARVEAETSTIRIQVAAQAVTIATKIPAIGKLESALKPAPATPRTIDPVRDVTADDDQKPDMNETKRLPVGCEPAFSPVTQPDLAHIGVRCDS
ncbi:hypothetical protein [Pseudorhodoplanes sp.]|uniref:hypothetical protein n=1 Tax=Pseudorhodoplanes sp. TaxID=1934341 RepID=UPI00391D37AB